MNGNRIFLDTNAIIALLGGNTDLVTRCKGAEWVGVSIISELELFAFQGLEDGERQAIVQFLDRVEVSGLDHDNQIMVQGIADLRQTTGLKLPDAIIAAQAMLNSATLFTRDKALLNCCYDGGQVSDF